MYNLRYHIASLVAIFFALTVGLLLGGVVVERGTLQNQKTTLVDSLRKSYEGLSADQRTLKAENDALAAFSDQAAVQVVSGVLAGRTVVVLADPASGDVVSEVTRAVRDAGVRCGGRAGVCGCGVGRGNRRRRDVRHRGARIGVDDPGRREAGHGRADQGRSPAGGGLHP
jgi:hypothetical protein